MLQNIPLGRKVTSALAACAVVVAAVVWIALVQTRSGTERLSSLVEVNFPGLQALETIHGGLATVSRGVNALLIPEVAAASEKERKVGLEMAEEALSTIEVARQSWERLPHPPEISTRWQAVQAAYDPWHAGARATLDAIRAWHRAMATGKQEDAAAARTRAIEQFWVTRQAYVKLAGPLGELIQADADLVGAVKVDALAAARQTYASIAVVGVTSFLGLLLLSLVAWRDVGKTVSALVREAGGLTEAVREGRLSERASPAAVSPEFRPVVEGMNETMDAFARPIEVTADYIGRISHGDIPPKITEAYQGDFSHIKDALNGCIDALSDLLGELGRMTAAQVAGDTDAYVDERRFEGAFRKLAAGVNENTRVNIENTHEALVVLGKYGAGDLTATMRPLPGKAAAVNRALDGIRSNLTVVAEQVQSLARAAVEGRLSVRADASQVTGVWRAVVEGMNEAIDAIVTPFRVISEYCERISHGDIPPRRTNHVVGDIVAMQASLNRCVDALSAMVADVNALVQAAGEGRLDARIDVARHEGAFRAALDGVNRTLEAVTAPVNEAAKVLGRLAERDLRARVEGDYRGDHARIKDAVNTTAVALDEALTQVAQAVDQVSSAATQIASSSQAVAAGASEQAASLEETTSSIESVASMTRQTADSAQQADQLARTASAAAAEGSSAVDRMQGAMGKIKASAEGTSQIIRDINDIAFQTNLLALNAAVEAARAGEAGRGFAVVAEEVRSLAMRAKEAATKTEELIRQSVNEAANGEVTARQAAAKLGEIAGGVTKVSEIVAEIAAAAREQSSGTEQVTKAVSEMDKVTQQNAASAEESSSAASELSGQAEELAAMVASFRLERAAAGAQPQRIVSRAAPRPTLPPARPARGANGVRHPADSRFPMDDELAAKDF